MICGEEEWHAGQAGCCGSWDGDEMVDGMSAHFGGYAMPACTGVKDNNLMGIWISDYRRSGKDVDVSEHPHLTGAGTRLLVCCWCTWMTNQRVVLHAAAYGGLHVVLGGTQALFALLSKSGTGCKHRTTTAARIESIVCGIQPVSKPVEYSRHTTGNSVNMLISWTPS